jgi:adenylyltransferase/sulfurtransferase
MLNKEESIRYDRHLRLNEIGHEGQLKLKHASVLVIGAGGLGCPAIQYLAAAGVGKIGIVDGDSISLSNLQRQILFRTEDIGKLKAEIAGQFVRTINPNIDVKLYTEFLHQDNALDILSDWNIVLDCADNFASRYLVNDSCIILDKPWVFGAIYKFSGQLSVFNWKGSPSYRCLFPEAPKEGESPSCSEIGVVGVLPGMIGVWQASEAIKMICGIGEVASGKFMQLDLLNNQMTGFDFSKNPDNFKIQSLQSGEYAHSCEIQTVPIYNFQRKENTNSIVIDIRSLEEREQETSIAEHILPEEIESKQEYLQQFGQIYIHCQTGKRAQKAAAEWKELFPDSQLIALIGDLSESSELKVE